MSEKTEMSEIKLCKDCKHYLQTNFDWCLRAITHETDLVTGNVYTRGKLEACVERRVQKVWKIFADDICGPEARFWEPKE